MRVLLVGVGTALLASCSSAATGPTDDLLVTAAVSPAAVRAGATVAVRVAVTNAGSRPREINIDTCREPFVVTDQSGAVAGPGPAVRLCHASLPMKELAPGDEYVFTLPWGAHVAPGAYALRGRVLARGGLVESRPVPISVAP